MKVGLYAWDNDRDRMVKKLEYSLKRRAGPCQVKICASGGGFWARRLEAEGVAYPTGLGGAQLYPGDGQIFLKALLLSTRVGREAACAEDDESLRLINRIKRDLRRGWSERPARIADWRQGTDIVLREVAIENPIEWLGIAQKAAMKAIRRRLPTGRRVYVLALPRFSTITEAAPGEKPNRDVTGPGRAEMYFTTKKALMRAFQLRVGRINKPPVDKFEQAVRGMHAVRQQQDQ